MHRFFKVNYQSFGSNLGRIVIDQIKLTKRNELKNWSITSCNHFNINIRNRFELTKNFD